MQLLILFKKDISVFKRFHRNCFKNKIVIVLYHVACIFECQKRGCMRC